MKVSVTKWRLCEKVHRLYKLHFHGLGNYSRLYNIIVHITSNNGQDIRESIGVLGSQKGKQKVGKFCTERFIWKSY